MACYNNGDFKKYFKENMDGLGLPSPSSAFDTFTTSVATLSTLAGTIRTYGATTSVATVAGGTFFAEKMVILGFIGTAYYAGAAIGSTAVAAGRSLGCGTRMIDVFSLIEKHNLQFDGWQRFYAQHPEIIDPNHPARKLFGIKARFQPELPVFA